MNTQMLTPVAIIVSGALIGGALFFSGSEGQDSHDLSVSSPKRTEHRNVYGEKNAAITIVEFSDYECPFCGRLHPTLERIVDESEGRINWEYRHLPLSIHRNANGAAVAAECVADLSGQDAFWRFSELLLQNQRALATEYYQETAAIIGIDESAFMTCLSDSKIQERIDRDMQVAAAFGGQGTPFSVIEYADGSTKGVSGALPREHWNALLNI